MCKPAVPHTALGAAAAAAEPFKPAQLTPGWRAQSAAAAAAAAMSAPAHAAQRRQLLRARLAFALAGAAGAFNGPATLNIVYAQVRLPLQLTACAPAPPAPPLC
jgi:hypothetical protein